MEQGLIGRVRLVIALDQSMFAARNFPLVTVPEPSAALSSGVAGVLTTRPVPGFRFASTRLRHGPVNAHDEFCHS